MSLAGWYDEGVGVSREALAGRKCGVYVNWWHRMLELVQQILLPTRAVTVGGCRVQPGP